MSKLLVVTVLVAIAALMACSGGDPTRAPTATTAPAPAETLTATPLPTATATAAPKPTPEPTATTAPEPSAIPEDPGVLAPLQALDSSALLSELSANELACVGDDPGKLARSLAGPGSAPREDQAKLIGCLDDETVARIFLAGFVPGPEPLSLETSDCVRAAFEVVDPREVMTAGLEGDCVRAAFEVVDPREVMTAGLEGDPGRAMAGSMAAFSVTTACLNDEEWAAAASMTGMGPDEREGMQCLLDQLGGPGQMATAMRAAQEGDFTDLAKAGADCGLNMGPAPDQAPVEAPTPVSTSTPAPTTAAPPGEQTP